MAPPSTDFLAIHGHPPHKNQFNTAQWLNVASLPCKGRGYIAAQFIPAGTVVHVAKPLAAVVSQEWTPETCAFCFRFNYPRRMKIKLTDVKDVCFCSEDCLFGFTHEGYKDESDLVIRSFRALEKAYRAVKDGEKPVSAPAWTPKPPASLDDDEALAHWLDTQVWAVATSDERLRNATWIPSKPERTMCRLIAACLARRQCESAHIFSKDHNNSRLVPFSDMNDIQYNEVAYLRSAWKEDKQLVPERIQEIIRLYIYFSSAVAGILDCPHQLFRAIYFRENANSFGLWEMPHGDNQGVTDDLELLGWGLYPSAVYFNHACDANITKTRDGRNMLFVANRDIEPGQEACIAYGSVEEPVLERQRRLLENYHFLCTCDRCNRELAADAAAQ